MSATNEVGMLAGREGGDSFDVKRYDRQLRYAEVDFVSRALSLTHYCVTAIDRLWGDHGQLAVSQAKVCLLGATATGTEILKNLILPGTLSGRSTRPVMIVG